MTTGAGSSDSNNSTEGSGSESESESGPAAETGTGTETETDTETETGDGDGDGDGGLPPGCEMWFVDDMVSCGTGVPAEEKCTYVSANPELVFEWALGMASDDPEMIDCTQAWLDLHEINSAASFPAFGAVADFATLESLCASAMIDYCAPAAVDGWCETFDQAGCAEALMCREVLARRVALDGTCLEPETFAICGPDNCFPDALVREDPEGRCWYFDSDCFDAQGWTSQSPSCPTLAEAQALPGCP